MDIIGNALNAVKQKAQDLFFQAGYNQQQGNASPVQNALVAAGSGAQNVVNNVAQHAPLQMSIPQPIAQIPFFGGIAQTGAGFVNSPGQYLQGIARTGQDIGYGLTGQRTVSPQNLIGDVAQTAQLPLMFVGGGAASNAIRSGSLLSKVGAGAATGAKYGAGFGALQGLQENRDAASVGQQLTSSVPSAVSGAVGGALLGGATPLAQAASSKLQDGMRASVSKLVPSQFAKDIQDKASGVLSHPTVAPYAKAFTLDPLTEKEAINAVVDLRRNTLNPQASKTIDTLTREFLPQQFHGLPTETQGKVWNYIIDRKHGAVPDVIPKEVLPLDQTIFHVSGNRLLQTGSISTKSTKPIESPIKAAEGLTVPSGKSGGIERPGEAQPQGQVSQTTTKPVLNEQTNLSSSSSIPRGVKPAAEAGLSDTKAIPTSFIKEAQSDKKLAQAKLKDKQWMSNASDMSKQMVQGNASKPVEQIAKEKWDYVKLRGTATNSTGGSYVAQGSLIDKPANDRYLQGLEELKQSHVAQQPIDDTKSLLINEAKKYKSVDEFKQGFSQMMSDFKQVDEGKQKLINPEGYKNYQAIKSYIEANKSDPSKNFNFNDIFNQSRVNQPNISADAIKNKQGKIVTSKFPTQTEIKDRVTQQMGNPDLYTQKTAKIEKAFGKDAVAAPSASERASIKQAQQLFGSSTPKDFGIKTVTDERGIPLSEVKGSTVKAPFGETKNNLNLKINGISEKDRVQSAIGNHEYVKNALITKGQDAYLSGLKLDRHDLKLSEQFEQGKNVENLAKQAHNPQAFTNYMKSSNDYYDFRLAADRAVGGATAKREYYMPHNWDLSSPKDLARFNMLAKQKGLRQWDGYRSQPRVFDTYAQGEALGFKRKFPNTLEDLKNDYQGSSAVLSKQALKRGLVEAAPDKVSASGKGLTETGKPFINSNIKNLEGISYHPDIHKMLKGFTPRSDTDLFKAVKEVGFKEALEKTGTKDTILSLYDHSTQPLKHFLLNLSAFHDINVGLAYAGKGLTNPIKGARGLLQSIPNTFSEKSTQATIKYFQNKVVGGKDYSVFEAGLRGGVNMSRGLPAQGTGHLNLLSTVGRSTFDRTLYTWKMNLVDMAYGSGKIDPRSPMGRELGKEVNKVIGEMNDRTMNIDPNTQKWLSRGLLAPQFTESKYSLLKDAATKGGAAGNFARQAVIGKSIVAGSIATFATALATGQYPALQQILTNYTVAPDIQTNLTNPKGKKQDISLPQTYLSEVLRPIIQSAQQHSADPLINYGQARLNPLISNAEKLVTNQDFYGNPIRDDTASVSDQAKQAAQGIGTGMLPIGAQNVANVAEGKMNPTQAIINAIGLRTHTSPNDPSVKYATTASDFERTLPADQQKALDAYQSVKAKLQMNPNDYNETLAKYRLLAADPQLAANVAKEEQLTAKATGGMANPISNYDPKQQQIIYSVESLPPNDAYSKQLKTDNPELFADYYAKMATYTDYLNKQNIQPKPGAQAYTAGPKPSDYDPKGQAGYVQSMLDAATNAKAAGYKTASYYNDPAVAAYMLASRSFQNTKLAQEGYNQIDKFGNILPANTSLALLAAGTNPASFDSGGGSGGYSKYGKGGRKFPPGMGMMSPINKLKSKIRNTGTRKLRAGLNATPKKVKVAPTKPIKLAGLTNKPKSKLTSIALGTSSKKKLTTSATSKLV